MIIADSCSIILLAKSTALEELAKWKEIKISKSVYKEVLKGKTKNLMDAFLLERLVNENKISVINPKSMGVSQKLADDFGLGDGEADSVTLVLENKGNILLTDNKQGRKAARVYCLPLVGSIDVITAMYKLKKIKKEKAINSLNILKKEGWFDNYLIEKALEEIENGQS